VALIRSNEPGRAHYDTAWTLNAALGAAIALGLIGLAPLAAQLYHEARVTPVIMTLACASLIGGFENIGVVAFRKELDFRKEFLYQVSRKLVVVFFTVPVAWMTHSYWALVFGTVFGRALGVMLSYLVHPYRPHISLAKVNALFGFSRWVLLVNFANFFRERMSDLVIGRQLGAYSLGMYNIGAEISNLPSTDLIAPINRAVYPVYARLYGDLPALRMHYLSVLGLIAFIAIPAGFGISVVAQLIAPTLLGAKWSEASVVIVILALNGVVQALQTNIYAVYLAVGKPRHQTVMQLVMFAVLLATVWPAAGRYGIAGVAWSYLISSLVALPINIAVLLRTLRLELRSFFATIVRPLLAATVMALAVRSMVAWLGVGTPGAGQLARLALYVASGAALYAISIALLWQACGRPPGPETSILTTLRRPFLRAQISAGGA